MDAESKIYVVVAVLSIILLGIGIYLNTLDRKIKKLEDEMKDD
jgi:CcmD family protein